MFWRAPWLRDRALLIVLAGLDALIILTVYESVLDMRTGATANPGNGAIFASIGWVFTSYIFGRYSKEQESEEPHALRRTILSSCAASLVVLILFILHSWAYQVVDAETRFRGFLVPTFSVTTVILGVIGYALRRAISLKGKKWLIVCREKEELAIRAEAIRDKIGSLMFCRPEEASEVIASEPRVNIAISSSLGLERNEAERFARVRSNGRRICQVTDWCEKELHRVPPELVGNDWLVFSDGFAIQPGRLWWRVKRLGDIALTSALLLATAPIVAVGMLMIAIEDGGPVFYRQVRTGIYGEEIEIWKLRSMRMNAEQNGPEWAQRNDPRITKVGKILRKTRIDELPQLISVLKVH